MKQSISILGAGSWGTTLSVIFSKKANHRVVLWSAFKEQVKSIVKNKENREFLAGVTITSNILVTDNLTQALESEIIILAVPVKYFAGILKRISREKIKINNKIFLSVSKGLDIDTFLTPADMIKKYLGLSKIAVLSGPTIAREVVKGVPAAATIASKDRLGLDSLEKIFKGTNLRVYKSKDLRGVELAGALKNVIAIGCGISDGLGFGTNTKAALVTRGLVEMSRLGVILGAKAETFWGISGLGDLTTTCFSFDSRNRFLGEQAGKGRKLRDISKKMNMVAEGIYTVKAVHKLNKTYNIELPITEQVYKVLYKNKNPRKAVEDLMARPFKDE
jgi:glycerol-3-phosphate dehydrogenase (NAD(P)+)